MKFLFTTILFSNVVVALLAFSFAYILLKRSRGNKIYFNFGMSNLFLGLWAVDVLMLFSICFYQT